METFEALEARLAQEMSNIGEHMYGDQDEENYESSVVSVNPVKKQKVDIEAEAVIEESTEREAAADIVKKVKFNGNFELMEKDTTKSKRKISEEFTGFTAAERKSSEEIMEKIVKAYSQYMARKTAIPTQDTKLATTPKTIDNRLFIKLNKMDLKSNTAVKPKQNGDISAITGEDEEPCRFFTKESLLLSEKRQVILRRYVEIFEQHIEERTLQKNVPHIIKVSSCLAANLFNSKTLFLARFKKEIARYRKQQQSKLQL